MGLKCLLRPKSELQEKRSKGFQRKNLLLLLLLRQSWTADLAVEKGLALKVSARLAAVPTNGRGARNRSNSFNEIFLLMLHLLWWQDEKLPSG